MERPERPSRHSKNNEKWKRILHRSEVADSDSSSEWSSDSESVIPRYFASSDRGTDTLVGPQLNNRNTFECTSVNLQPSTSSGVPFPLDLRSVFSMEGKRKRPDLPDMPGPSTSNNSHLLHHDYADTFRPGASADTYGWPCPVNRYSRPNSSQKRTRYAVPSNDMMLDLPGSSNGEDLEPSSPTTTPRQITVASLSESLPTAMESRHMLHPLPSEATDRFSMPLFKFHQRSNHRYHWTRRYRDVLNDLEASMSSAPPVAAARTEEPSDVQVIAMAGPSTSVPCPRTVQFKPPDAPNEEIIIVDDQQPAEIPVIRPAEIPVAEQMAPAAVAEDQSGGDQIDSDEEPLNQALISLLECPVCMEYMRPPIHQCRRGHLLCSHCKPKLQACPTCRARLSDNRNLCMEKVADKLHYPCKNAPDGCVNLLRLQTKQRHEANCHYRSFRCCIPGCEWKGVHARLLAHYTVTHPDRVLHGNDQTVRVVLGDMTTSTNQNWIISSHDELFRVNFITVKSQPRATLFDNGTRLQVFGCVQYIGPCNKAESYKYKLETKKFDGHMWRSAIYKRATHNDMKKCINFYTSGDCFCLRGDTAELLSERVGGETTLVVRVKVNPINDISAIM